MKYKFTFSTLIMIILYNPIFCQDSTSVSQSETISWLNLQISTREYSDIEGFTSMIWPFTLSHPDSLTFKVVKSVKRADGVYEVYQSMIVRIPLSMMDPQNIKTDNFGITIYATNNITAIHVKIYDCSPNQSNVLVYDLHQTTFYFQINGRYSSTPGGQFSTERLKNAIVNLINLNGGKVSNVKLKDDLDEEIKNKF